MENIMENLPSEVHWNILKYTRHPLAERFKNSNVVKCAELALDAHLDVVSFSNVFFNMLEVIDDNDDYDDAYMRHVCEFLVHPYDPNVEHANVYYDDDYEPSPYTREWYANPVEYDPGMDPTIGADDYDDDDDDDDDDDV